MSGSALTWVGSTPPMEYDPDQSNPLLALGLPPGASEQDVKRAYRRLLKQHRPERDPEGFQRLRLIFESAMEIATSDSDPSIERPSAAPKPRSPLEEIESASDMKSSDIVELSEEELLDALRSQAKFSTLFEGLSKDLEAGQINEAIAKLKSTEGALAGEDPDAWVLGIVVLAQRQLPESPDTCGRLLDQAETTALNAGPAFDRLEQARWFLRVSRDLIAAASDSAIYPPLVGFLRDALTLGVQDACLDHLIPLQEAALKGEWKPGLSFGELRSAYPNLHTAWIDVTKQSTQWLTQLDASRRTPDHPNSLPNRTKRLTKNYRQLRDPKRVKSPVPAVMAAITVSPYAIWAISNRLQEGSSEWNYAPVFFSVLAFGLLTPLYDTVRRFFYLKKHYVSALKQFNHLGVPVLSYLESVDCNPPEIVSGALAYLQNAGRADAFNLANLFSSLVKAMLPDDQ